MSVKILFSDKLHFHERNFKSLIEVVSNNKFDVEYNTEYQDWMSLYGDYSDKYGSLQSYNSLLSVLAKSELYNYNVRGLNVYEIAKAELLAYIIPIKELYKLDLSDNDDDLFNFIFDNYHYELCLNMSAAVFWLDFWYGKILLNKKKYTHIFVFSGSNIYAKALIKTCQCTISRCFVTESSLTGNDFYIEEKLSHIANNSDLKLLSVRNKHLTALSEDERPYNTKIKAINKLNLAKNKNVLQPYSELKYIEFSNNNSTVVILGQVVNDYSVIETKLGYLSSISIYKKLIDDILINTNLNVIFKAHPWEEKKTNCLFDITYYEISKYIKKFDDVMLSRIKIVKDFDIDMIFSISKHAIVINSQSGLEAASHGIKPITLGSPFYGDFGFTTDVKNIDKISNILNTSNGSLSIDEYDSYENYITIYLEKHLYSVNPSGRSKILREIFSPYHIIPLVVKKEPKKIIEKEITSEIDFKDKVSLLGLSSEINELTTTTQLKNGILYFFTDFEKFKKKIKNRL
ncbi:capsular biosynthesis protein [Photobacterium phosphoreum]|uniref:capsular biosynthesis protein n=1 Tax=Photobacterium phosphoreum TaxID=659 RepID=UPI001E329558|nr:capsular biosynthesis protein [Photobacterium phosphoreum]MCD9521139.1 capsule biosynthesis protein [Photobacterium phosphoreum]